jgi:hypothetical protein
MTEVANPSPEQEPTEVEPAIPEVSAEGLEEVLAGATTVIIGVARLREQAAKDRESDNITIMARGVQKRKLADDQVVEVVQIMNVLDTILPLPDETSWKTEISARAQAIVEQQDAKAQS